MKCVLFSYNASVFHTNLAIRTLRTAISDLPSHPEVEIFEFSLKDKRDFVLNALQTEKADLYGFSTYIWNINETLSLAGNLKKLLPSAKIFFGGPEAGCRAEEISENYGFIDTVIEGEGEEAVKELISSFPEMPKIIHGVCDPLFLKRKPHYFIKNSLPDGKEEYIPEDLPKGKLVYYESSRGCPFTCAYCLSGKGGKVIAKTAKDTLSDLLMFEKLPGGTRTVKLVDRTFNYDISRAKEIVSGLCGPEYTNRYHFEIQPSLIDEEFVGILANAPEGRFQLEVGIQSTCEKVLDACGRKGNIEKELSNLRLLKEKTNIPLHVDLIVGLPESSAYDVISSINTVYYLSHELQLGFLKVLPGTKMSSDAEKYGIVYRSEPPYEVLYTNSLSFDEIFMFKGIAHTLDRVSGSGKFAHALDFLLGSDQIRAKTSPFEFFKTLSLLLGGDPAAYSQAAIYEKVFYAGQRFCISESEKAELRENCRADFRENERTHMPPALR